MSAKPIDGSSIDAEQLWSRIDPTGPCWEWIGRRNAGGYGTYGRRVAHRVVYAVLVGDPEGHLDLDHLCRDRGCVNPDHLEPVTRSENVRRGARPLLGRPGRDKNAALCGAGKHAWSAENIYTASTGVRHCRPCRTEYARNT